MIIYYVCISKPTRVLQALEYANTVFGRKLGNTQRKNYRKDEDGDRSSYPGWCWFSQSIPVFTQQVTFIESKASHHHVMQTIMIHRIVSIAEVAEVASSCIQACPRHMLLFHWFHSLITFTVICSIVMCFLGMCTLRPLSQGKSFLGTLCSGFIWF